MKTSILKSLCWAVVIATLAWSCQNEPFNTIPSAQEQVVINNAAESNSQIMASAQDVMDITSNAIVSKGLTGGRKISPATGRMGQHGCDPVVTASFNVYKSPDSVAIKGSLVIDFGDGSSCPDSTDIIKGKILDTFDLMLSRKDSISFSLTDSITFDGFQKDSVELAGLFVKHATEWQTSTLDIHDARITYGDGTVVTWSGSLTSVLGQIAVSPKNDDATQDEGDDGEMDDNEEHGDSVGTSDHEDYWSYGRTVTGSISGTTRDGAAFTAEITTPIVYNFSCSRKVPVSGVLTLTVGGVESTIDYGNGSCNRMYTIDSGGETTEHHFSHHHWQH